MKHMLFLAGLLLALTTASGCTAMSGRYVLMGRAVEGDFGSMAFVAVDDPQLEGLPLAHANISVYRDAGRPNQRLIATARTDSAGMINIPIDEFGTGWMQESWLIQVVKPGYETVEMPLSFPRNYRKNRLLIIMYPGISTRPIGTDELWKEYERYR